MKLTRKLLVLAAGLVTGVGVATTSWAYFTSSGSGTASATVGTWKNDTTTALTSSVNPSVVGQSVTYTATVTASGSGSPTGNVEFFDGSTPISGCGGTSGAPVSASSAVCAQTYAAVGTHSITAKYLGDTNFNASPLSLTLAQTVNKAPTSSSLTLIGSPATYGSENAVVFTSTVSATSGTPTGTVAIKQGGATLCSITLPATTCSPSATALNAAPTAYSITAVYSGDSNYVGSTSAAQDLNVNKAKPVITWSTPAAITYGTQLSTTQLNATADALGNFAYSPAAGTVLAAGSHGLTVVFTPSDTTNYEGTTAGVTLLVNKAAQTITFTSTAPSSAKVGGATYPVAATGGASGNPVTFSLDSTSSGCSLAGSTVSFIAVGTCKINANQAGDSNYNAAAQAQQSFAVAKGDQTITFAGPASGSVGTTATLSATATSGLTVSFASTTTPTCTVSGTTVTYITAGTCTINATQTGDTNWNAAAAVPRSFIVAKGNQTISFTSTAPPAASTGGSATYAPTATATSGLAVTFTIDPSSTTVCSISSGIVSFTTGGTCKVNANQAGNANWNAAPPVQQSFTISGPVGLGIVITTGGTGTPVATCGPISTNYTCDVTGTGNGGNVKFFVTFVNSSGAQVIYSSTQAATISETGQNSGTVQIAAGATSSSPNNLTASHTGSSAKTSTLTFGPYTLAINVS